MDFCRTKIKEKILKNQKIIIKKNEKKKIKKNRKDEIN